MRDAWDRRDFDATAGTLPPLADAVTRLTEASTLGVDMARDMFAALHKHAPLREQNVPASHAVNAAVRDAALDSIAYRELHPKCVGDEFLTGVAVNAMSEELVGLYDTLAPDINEAAQAAQAAEQAYRDAATPVVDANGDPVAVDDDTLAELRALLDEARNNLDGAVEAGKAKIGKAARAACTAARNEVVDNEAAAGAWAGFAAGDVTVTDPRARFETMRMLRTGAMRRITDAFGRFKALSFGARETRWSRGPDEVFSVTVGDDLETVLVDELAGLAIPALRDDFYRRYSEGDLLCYDLRKRERVGRGPIVLVEDSSGSMEGARYEAAKAIGLTLATTAMEHDRAFRALVFGGSGNYVEMPVTGMDEAVAYASTFLNSGGTDVGTPLLRAFDIIEGDELDMANADIVVITDGLVHLTPEWVQAFRERKDASGARVWTIVVDAEATPAIRSVSDRVATVVDLLDADSEQALSTLFADVATEPAN